MPTYGFYGVLATLNTKSGSRMWELNRPDESIPPSRRTVVTHHDNNQA